MDQDKTADKVNPAFPLDIECEREAFKEFKQRTRKSRYLYIDHDFRLMNFSHTGEIYENPAVQSEFELWLASASIPRPVPAEPAKEPIGQAWGVWAEKPEGGSGFINQNRLIFPFSEDEIDRHVIELNKISILNWRYEKRQLWIYDAPQPSEAPYARSISEEIMDCVDRLGSESAEVDRRAWEHLLVYAPIDILLKRTSKAPAAPQIQPNVWLPFKDAPRDLDESVDLWDQKEGRIPDCYFDSLLLRWRNSFGVVRVSNVTHFMAVNPPIDTDKPSDNTPEPKPKESYPRCTHKLR